MAAIDFDGQFFWRGLEGGLLLIQQCVACGKMRYPPKARCLACGDIDSAIAQASGLGTLFSYTTVYKPPLPGLTLPMTLGLVALEEGVRILAPLDRSITEPTIGMKLQAAFGANDIAPAPLRFVADRSL